MLAPRLVDQGGSRGTVQLRAGSGIRAARRSTRSCVARSADTVLRGGALVQAVILRFEPGGRLRRHPAGSPQILAVLEGSGEVSGASGVDEPIGAGEAVFLHEGEDHELNVRGRADGAHHRGRACGSVSRASGRPRIPEAGCSSDIPARLRHSSDSPLSPARFCSSSTRERRAGPSPRLPSTRPRVRASRT